jgi:hypothetical protein
MADSTPDFTEKRDDWECSGFFDITGGAGLAAGAWLMTFRNGTYSGKNPDLIAYTGNEYDFLFLGGGFGGGLGFGIAKPVRDLAKNLAKTIKGKSFTSITCKRAFSADDLNWSAGRISTISAGVLIVGAKAISISAWPLGDSDNPYFYSQTSAGMSNSIGVSGTCAPFGLWIYLF